MALLLTEADCYYFPSDADGTECAHLHTECRNLVLATIAQRNYEMYVNVQKVVTGQTLLSVQEKQYISNKMKTVDFDVEKFKKAAIGTKLIKEKWVNVNNREPLFFENTHIHVLEGDYMDLTALVHRKMEKAKIDDKPCVIMSVHPTKAFMNFLNEGVNYCDGVEEEAYRRTTLACNTVDCNKFATNQREWQYILPEFGGIYAPGVEIFRAGERKGYFFYHGKRPSCSFVLTAPLKKQKFIQLKKEEFEMYDREKIGTDLRITKKYAQKIRKKYTIALNIAYQQQHRCVIIAGPCECFKNPAWHVAHILKKVIEKDFKNKFEEIIFCSVDDWRDEDTLKRTDELRYVLNEIQPIHYPFAGRFSRFKHTYKHPKQREMFEYKFEETKFKTLLDENRFVDHRRDLTAIPNKYFRIIGGKSASNKKEKEDRVVVLKRDIEEMKEMIVKLENENRKEKKESAKIFQDVQIYYNGLKQIQRGFNGENRYKSQLEDV